MKIVVLDAWAGNPGIFSWDELREIGECDIYDRTPAGEALQRCKDADMVLTNKVAISRGMMERLPRLKYIGVLATGYNIIDIAAARERGIVVSNVPAYSTASVAQMVMAHILEHTNHIAHYTQQARAGVWSRCPDFSYCDEPITELAGKTMGIVGLGHVGSAVARIALALGMKVKAFTSKPQQSLPQGVTSVSMDELFATSDVVTLHCPLTSDTQGLVNAARLATMKKTALLINTGRGQLVVEQDLADALNGGVIAGAGVDVLSQEPPAANCPLLTARNCTITPHVAWSSREAQARLMRIVVDNAKAFASGKPINNVAK